MSDLTTDILSASSEGYEAAKTIWSAGGLVAFPTETVYGLGADARNDKAVAGIYEAKGRPSFNPLIVHIADIEMAQRYVEWSDLAQNLASAFWPGPLTLVLPLKAGASISKLVTAGLPTLAVRVPAHPIARALLTHFDGPVAAPSANPSGRISPTLAEHVSAGLSGRIDAILDGGACEVGLESTIVGLSQEPTLLRPGGVPQSAIEQALGTEISQHTQADPLVAPGQMSSHYAPKVPVRLNADIAKDGETLLGFGNVASALNLSKSADLREAAANLFGHLHKLDQSDAKAIAVSPIPMVGLGVAINDRLKRAAAPRDSEN